MKCPECYREIDDDSVFCEYCGEPINKSDSNKPIWIILALFFILGMVCSIGIISYFHNQNNGEPSMEEAVDTLKGDNILIE